MPFPCSESTRTTLITGAASGIGRALSLALAKPGHVLCLADRDASGLAAVAHSCEAAGALTRTTLLDVTDRAAAAHWIGTAGRIDLLVTCAGLNAGSIVGPPECTEVARRVLAVNLDGTLNVALPALERMEQQPPDAGGLRGRIAVLASLAAFVSVPGAPAYCASKAAVDAWAVGMAHPARERGVQVTSICPGYVRTPMTAINGFRMRGLMEPERAAMLILRAVRRGRVRAAFPLHMALCSRIGALLPAGSAALMLARRRRLAALREATADG